jgi:enoyl-[acyl-carrier protein] reductase I
MYLVSFHKMQVLYKRYERVEYCCTILYGSTACFPDYNDMADNKAYLESIARSFGYFFGRDKSEGKYISQSPTATKAGQAVKGFRFYCFSEKCHLR